MKFFGKLLKLRVQAFALASVLLLQVLCAALATAPQPKPESGEIGMMVGNLLAREHYLRQPLDDKISVQFLKFYLDALDYNHSMFLQSDIQEFQKYATTLDDATLHSDVKPGFEMFARYLQRVEEKVALVNKLLQENFTFDQDEKILVDRTEAPWPANEEESHKLWKQRIKFELLQERLNKKKDAEAKTIITKRYNNLLRTVREMDSESVLQNYLTALAHVYDPHSDYLPPTELNNFSISMKLSLFGIGAILSSEDGFPKIIAIVPGGPADLDKRLKVNDRIAGVAQGSGEMVDVEGMKLSKAVELIRGEKNTEVRLSVIPSGATDRIEVKLKRDEIKMTEAEAKAKLIERKDGPEGARRLGYIELPSFYTDFQNGPDAKSTAHDVASLIEELKKRNIDGLVLDLRRNGGGSLSEAIDLTGLFIKSGPIVQIKNSKGNVSLYKDKDSSVLYDGPLVILVNHSSASASEILAAALQDYERAVIVGDQSTFGKGTVQKFEELNRSFVAIFGGRDIGGALKLTTQKFYRVSGKSTQYKGVTPDVQWPSLLDYLKVNEASYKNAIPYDEVQPASFDLAKSFPKSCLQDLRNRSQQRIAKDPEFAYINDDIARLKVQLEEKTISLNEAKRLEEKKANDQRVEKRKKERLARKDNSSITTDISLESLNGSSSGPALTKKVLDQASANLKEQDEDAIPDDSSVDPELQEGLKVLQDLIEATSKALKGNASTK